MTRHKTIKNLEFVVKRPF